jgi:hypothetical protein
LRGRDLTAIRPILTPIFDDPGLVLFFASAAAFAKDPALDYPKAEKGSQVDGYFGTKVADPYRGFEDADSPDRGESSVLTPGTEAAGARS